MTSVMLLLFLNPRPGQPSDQRLEQQSLRQSVQSHSRIWRRDLRQKHSERLQSSEIEREWQSFSYLRYAAWANLSLIVILKEGGADNR